MTTRKPRPARGKPRPAARKPRISAPLPVAAALLALLVVGAGALAGRDQTAEPVSTAPEPRVQIRVPDDQQDKVRSMASVFACYGLYEHAVIRATYNGNRNWRPGQPLTLNLQPTEAEAAVTPGARALVREVESLRREGATHCSR
jgi:hypothetical protein